MVAAPYVVGVDVGASSLHAVSLDRRGGLLGAAVLDATDLEVAVAWAAHAEIAAIDAPDRPSTGAHRADESLPAKFQAARCAEVALARKRGYWVPWVTPASPTPGTWIAVGIRLHESCRAEGTGTIEVYPHAAFRELANGDALPKKTSRAGTLRRADLLRESGIDEAFLEMWSHDALDAAVGALVAYDASQERAVRVGCEPGACAGDGSAIWLPHRRA